MDIFKTGYYLLNTSMFRYSADLSPGASEFPVDFTGSRYWFCGHNHGIRLSPSITSVYFPMLGDL